MLEKFCYMPGLDEIDTSLPSSEITIRRIAKHGSRLCTLLGWAIIFPIVILSIIFDKVGGKFFSALMYNGVLKPARFLFYHFFYWPLKGLVSISGNAKS
jgi:hypothetical protein